MSLTSYRAAPPRANSVAPRKRSGAGTYSRFEEDVKRIEPPRWAAPLSPYMGLPKPFVNRFGRYSPCGPLEGLAAN